MISWELSDHKREVVWNLGKWFDLHEKSAILQLGLLDVHGGAIRKAGVAGGAMVGQIRLQIEEFTESDLGSEAVYLRLQGTPVMEAGRVQMEPLILNCLF